MLDSSKFDDLLSLCKQLLKSFFVSPKISGLNSGATLMLIRSFERPDLSKDFDYLLSCMGPEAERVRIEPKSFVLNIFSLSDLAVARRNYSYTLENISVHLNASLTQRATIFLALIEISKMKRLFEQLISSDEVLIFTMDMQFYDNILAQVARSAAAETFGFQHGFYHDDGNLISSSNVNPVNYLAAVCRTALIWGEFSAAALKKYTSQKLVIVGKPTVLVPSLRVHQKRDRQKRNRVLVILDSVKNREKNMEVLADLESLSKEVCIIPHPDDQEQYRSKRLRVTTHGDSDYDAVFCINSSAAIQYGFAGYKIYLHPDSAIARQFGLDFAVDAKDRFGERFYFSVASSVGAALNPWKKFIETHGNEFSERLWEALPMRARGGRRRV
jgi:hypothetical protein